jgi:hypothetical protein
MAFATASGDLLTVMAPLGATTSAYAYRIVEDAMLVARFGASYRRYCGTVGALMPFRSFRKIADEPKPVNEGWKDDQPSTESR